MAQTGWLHNKTHTHTSGQSKNGFVHVDICGLYGGDALLTILEVISPILSEKTCQKIADKVGPRVLITIEDKVFMLRPLESHEFDDVLTAGGMATTAYEAFTLMAQYKHPDYPIQTK